MVLSPASWLEQMSSKVELVMFLFKKKKITSYSMLMVRGTQLIPSHQVGIWRAQTLRRIEKWRPNWSLVAASPNTTTRINIVSVSLL